MRTDCLDTVVRNPITALLTEPQLIRTGIGKRPRTAKASDPVVTQRKRLDLDVALAKARASNRELDPVNRL
ncbi:hypothetical protein ACIBG0_37040 [Nocardia sp. NPDC050630]|uniref:hypothetical protein n=1 Tax=Nocardia sp. NPDC050630 TaxID=3364321 RepID=UPI0037B671EE